MRTVASRRYLALAWLSLVCYVVFGVWGSGQRTVYETTGWVSGPFNPWAVVWTMLVREIPGLAALAAPGIAAWIFGHLARRAGDRRGLVPAWIGLTLSTGTILLSIVAVLPLG